MPLERHAPSPNHNARPSGAARPVTAVILHADASPTEHGTIDWLSRRESGVSYHWLIGRKGDRYLLVPEHRRAWHAGRSWFGAPNVNDFSVGIAIANRNDGREAIPPAQYAALLGLTVEVCRRWGVPWSRVAVHRQVAVPQGRKSDIHPHVFPWGAFQRDLEAALAKGAAA